MPGEMVTESKVGGTTVNGVQVLESPDWEQPPVLEAPLTPEKPFEAQSN